MRISDLIEVPEEKSNPHPQIKQKSFGKKVRQYGVFPLLLPLIRVFGF
jgi:hypothetical protein